MGISKSVKPFAVVGLLALLQVGCDSQMSANPKQFIPPEDNLGGIETTTTTTLPTQASFCSYLSFDQVAWNSEFTIQEKRSFAISLSLSGSFEGNNGWRNLTNNFDGQGMSAGLLNQTLGTGSLQPLLSRLKTGSRDTFFLHLAQSRADSLIGMVGDWERANGGARSMASTEDFMRITSSKLDSDYIEPMANESASVSWAKKNLYQSNGNFKPEWSRELKSLLGDPNYVSLQIRAAENIHEKALLYVQRVKIFDLRTYLFMFDIVVQNGGINEDEFRQVDHITEPTQKLLQLLEIRVKRSNPQWQSDVRLRKKAIILGTGTVHGSARNFPKEFCFEQSDKIL